MSLRTIVQQGVKIANRVTGSLQTNVLHAAWIASRDGYPEPEYDADVSRPAIVQYVDRLQQNSTGEQIMVHAKVMFISTVPPNGASGRREPIDPRDRITLPDGYVGTILDITGIIDPSTNGLYLYEVSLGG